MTLQAGDLTPKRGFKQGYKKGRKVGQGKKKKRR